MKCPHCHKKLRIVSWAWNGAWHGPIKWTIPLDDVEQVLQMRWNDCYLALCRECGEPVS